MRVAQMIELLNTMNPEAEVTAFNADAQEIVPVTGAVFNSSQVELQTDDQTCGPHCWGPCGTCGAHVHENAHGRFCPNCGSV